MTTSTGDADTDRAIADEYTELATTLAALPLAAWDAPSLCAGWRTREVVAHVTMPVRYSTPRFLLELVKARGKFNRMADVCARRDAVLTPDQLVAGLRQDKLHRWRPPGGSADGALTHAVVHGLDVTVALGLDRQIPHDRIRKVLDALTKADSLRFFGPDRDGIELRATDLDWSFGSGGAVSGVAQNLALVLAGRTLPAGALQGEGAERFTAGAGPQWSAA
jgi:uncharacterized protein (TIGR03083 family)